jgi:hypothetical protein
MPKTKSKVNVDKVDDEAPRAGVLLTSMKYTSKMKLKINADKVDGESPSSRTHVDEEVVGEAPLCRTMSTTKWW